MAKLSSLQEKFHSLLGYLIPVLNMTGIFLLPSQSSSFKMLLKRFWSVFLLVLCVQSNIYIVVKQTCVLNGFSGCSINCFIGNLVQAMIRLTSLFCDTIIHVTLIISIERTITSFLLLLESVDCEFNWPGMSLRIQRISFIGLVYSLVTVFLKWSFSVQWELFHAQSYFWFDCLQNLIRIFGNQWFTVVPVWIFFICGQLIVLIFEDATASLKALINQDDKKICKRESISHEIFKALRCTKQLNLASHFLHQRFKIMILAVCFLSTVTLLSSSYYILHRYWEHMNFMVILCDATGAIDCYIRFWLMCYISDRMRKAASDCIPLLQEIRDDFIKSKDSLFVRNKITLFIVEAATVQKDINRLSLFGMLPLTKNLILKVSETVATFLIIILQFNN